MTNMFHISRVSDSTSHHNDYMLASLNILTQGGEQTIRFRLSLSNFGRALIGEKVRVDDVIIHNRDAAKEE